MNIDLKINRLPIYRADWAPIYFEPITNSGERLTIGIILRDERGYEVKNILDETILKSIFGKKYKHIIEMTNFVFDGMKKLDFQNNYTDISFPLTGFSLGSWSNAASTKFREGVLEQAIYQSSIFSSVVNAIDSDGERATVSNTNFVSKVKSSVLKSRPELVDYFDVQVSLVRDGFPPKLNFLYRMNGANIGQLNSNSVNGSFKFLRSKLHELHQARRSEKIGKGTLIVAPNANKSISDDNSENDVSRAIRELEYESKQDNLNLRIAQDFRQASACILEIAEAA